MAKTTNKEVKKNEDLIFTGTVKKAYNGSTKYDEEAKNRVTIYNPDFPYEKITAYENVGSKMQPGWYKEAEGYINLSSKFDIPVRNSQGKEITFEAWINGDDTHNATVKVKIRQKDGAIYPICIVVLQDGEPVDPFEGMDD